MIGGDSGQLAVYNESYSLIHLNLKAHSNLIYRIKEAQSGLIVTASYDSKVKVWDSINNWNLTGAYTGHSSPVYSLVYISYDVMASGESNRYIKIWIMSSLTTLKTIYAGDAVFCLALLNNGIYLASGHSTFIIIWNINYGSLVATLTGHSSGVYGLAVINDELLASCSVDQTVRIWNMSTNSLKFTLYGHTNIINGIKLIAADVIASGSVDSIIILWNTTSGTLIRTLTGHNSSVNALGLFDSQTLISVSGDSTMKLWQISTGTLFKSINVGSRIAIISIAVTGIVSNTCK